MKAAYIRETGGPSVIQYGELPEPDLRPGQVLIATEATAVNPIDTYIRSGAVPMDLPDPFILGCDMAGRVEAVGEGVVGLRSGDRVWCTNQGLLGRQGVFAERCAVDAQWVYPLPDGIDAEAGAACALVGITAHLGLFREAHLQAGQTVFVRGGTGGVGSMVVQMAKAMGATVITTAGTPEKIEACRDLGADHVIHYPSESTDERLKELAPGGVNVFWETLLVPQFDQAVEALARRGTIVLMAGREARPEFPVGPFYVKECRLRGFVMFKAPPEEMRQAADDINRWLAEGQLRPVIGRRMKLAEAADAHRLQEENTLRGAATLAGKIVLHV